MTARSWFVRPSHRARRQPGVEPLEDRCLPSPDLLAALGFRPIDGAGNNQAHPTWGSAGADLLRLAPAAYGDGVSTPGGADRPSARVVSNTVAAQGDQDAVNNRLMS